MPFRGRLAGGHERQPRVYAALRALLSVGRVQTPTLAMLVTRRLEIDRFVPQPFWTVQADFGDYQGVWFDPSREDGKRIPSEAAARAIADKVRGKPARVTGVKAEESASSRPSSTT